MPLLELWGRAKMSEHEHLPVDLVGVGTAFIYLVELASFEGGRDRVLSPEGLRLISEF